MSCDHETCLVRAIDRQEKKHNSSSRSPFDMLASALCWWIQRLIQDLITRRAFKCRRIANARSVNTLCVRISQLKPYLGSFFMLGDSDTARIKGSRGCKHPNQDEGWKTQSHCRHMHVQQAHKQEFARSQSRGQKKCRHHNKRYSRQIARRL